MKIISSGSAIALAALLMVAGCGAAEESPQPTTGASAASATTSTGVDVTTDAEASPTLSDLPSTSAPVMVSTETTVEPTTATPPSTSVAAPSSQPATSAPPVAEFPTTYADPEQIEALGYATNPLCEVLSVDEVTALLGLPVQPAIDDAAGTGCLWNTTATDAGFLQLQMVGDPALYLPPGDAESVAGIGDAAFVGATEGGWIAQAQNPDGTFAVRVSGATVTKEAAVEGLRRLLERY